MPVHVPDPPQEVRDTVRTTLRHFAEHSHFSTEALRRAHPDQLDVSTPHQVYTIGLDDVRSGAGLEKARPVGWRYIVESAGQPIASAETALHADGSTPVLSHFNEGPFVSATADAVKAAAALPPLQAGSFELRLLRIPALYVMALWYHSATTDLLVPLAPSPIGREGQAVPAAEFMSELSKLPPQGGIPGMPQTPPTP